MAPTPRPPAERFWPKVQRTETCWLWLAGKMGAGYGKFMWTMGMEIGAHRASYMLTVGPVPKGMDVCHRCDNPICVNPDHLFLATHYENMRDMVRKGRHYVRLLEGAENGRAKLSVEDVRTIRARYAESHNVLILAREFGVSRRSIHNIVSGMTWSGVT